MVEPAAAQQCRTLSSQCLFAHSLRKFSMRDWGIEQKWMGILLPLLLLYNGVCMSHGAGGPCMRECPCVGVGPWGSGSLCGKGSCVGVGHCGRVSLGVCVEYILVECVPKGACRVGVGILCPCVSPLGCQLPHIMSSSDGTWELTMMLLRVPALSPSPSGSRGVRPQGAGWPWSHPGFDIDRNEWGWLGIITSGNP